MDKPGHYRELAAHCVRMASETSNQAHKATLLEMAQRWRDLAEHVARAELKTSSVEKSPSDPKT
jgi:hypothetical protein